MKLLNNSVEVLTRDGQSIGVVGLAPGNGGISEIARHFSQDQCVLTLAHSPTRIVDIRIAEAGDSGPWTDLVLTGHTHGGQLRIAGRSIFSLDEVEQRYLSGWYSDAAAPLLVSQGVGCEGANLRLGSEAEVWLITLRCAQ